MGNFQFKNLDNLSLQELENEAELIPLLTSEDEEALQNESLPPQVPILPLKNTVLFPGVVIPITAGRDKSIQLIKDANSGEKVIGVVAQRDLTEENPGPQDLYDLGTVAQILRVLKMPDGNTTVIIQGKKRFQIDQYIQEQPYLKATIRPVEEQSPAEQDSEFNATVDSIKELALKIIEENPNIPTEAAFAIKNIQSPIFLINFVSSNMNLTSRKTGNFGDDISSGRALKCLKYMDVEYQKLVLKNDIKNRVRNELTRNSGSTICISK